MLGPNLGGARMLRTYLLSGIVAVAFLVAAVPVGAAEQGKASSWTSERMRLTPPGPRKLPTFADELTGNCAGLTVMIKTRIEGLKALEAKAVGQQWPPPSGVELWSTRPLGGDTARQREHIAQLNAALGAKGCQTVDVKAELQRAPSASAPAKNRGVR